jgi:predicted transcriptional regulator
MPEVENRIIDLTAQIVSAHVATNTVALDQLSALIRSVHQALTTISQTAIESSQTEPTVSARKSVFPDHILCLNCGQRFKVLKRHISTYHQMTPDEYRTEWGLPPSYPMVAAEYSVTRSKVALASGLGRKVVVPVPKRRGRPTRS